MINEIKEIIASDMKELKDTLSEKFKEIKPESDMKDEDAKGFWDGLFEKMESQEDGEYYNSYEDRLSKTPSPENTERGSWEGERGESKYKPSDETELGAKAVEKLNEKGLDGIEYKNAEPDFSKCSEATVQIDNMTENRHDYQDASGKMQEGNFSQADKKCAELWNKQGKDNKTDWSPADVENWRHENNCSWHERCDTKTMDLVPYDIHSYCGHYGGVAECKVRDAVDFGGGFDE